MRARGPGRVDLLRPRGRPRRARPDAGGGVGGRRPCAARGDAAARDAGRRRARPRATRWRVPPDSVPAERKAELLRGPARSAPAPPAARSPRCRVGYAESRRRVEVYNSELAGRGRRPHPRAPRACRRWPAAATASRPGATRAAGTPASSCSRREPEEVAERAARRALWRCSTRWTPPRDGCRWWWATASAACCCTRRWATGSRPTRSRRARACTPGKLGEQLAEPFVTAYDDGERTGEWGSDGIDDEGTPTRPHDRHRGRAAHLLPLRPADAPAATAWTPRATGGARRSATCRSRA